MTVKTTCNNQIERKKKENIEKNNNFSIAPMLSNVLNECGDDDKYKRRIN